MSGKFVVAGAQMGPIARDEPRSSAVARMCVLMRTAHARGAALVVFPELALTNFSRAGSWRTRPRSTPGSSPRCPTPTSSHCSTSPASWASASTSATANAPPRGGISTPRSWSDRTAKSRANTARSTCPDTARTRPGGRSSISRNAISKKGDLGFNTFDAYGGKLGMCICNDRRWPETWRVLGPGGAELVLLGYNTPLHYPPAPEHDHLQYFHNELSVQAGCYQEGLRAVAVAKAGLEEGSELIGGSMIVAPAGEIHARAATVADEIITAEVDLDRCAEIRANVFNFALHREPADYAPFTAAKAE